MIRAGVLTVGSSWSANAACGLPSSGNSPVECASVAVSLGSTAQPKSLRLSARRRRTCADLRLHKFVVRAQNSGEVDEVLSKIDKKDVDDTPLKSDATVDVSKSSDTGDSEAFFEDVQADSQVILDSVDQPAAGSKSDLTRENAQQKIVDTAKDGIEVLKWAAEGVVSAGLNAKEGLGLAKGLIDKRLKSFTAAVDETKEVSSQVAEVAQKKFEELQGSATKFSEEFQVNIEEKKAADSLKPESEVNPIAKLEKEIGENVAKATAEDGPVTKLSETLASGWEKVSKAGQDIASQAAKKGDEIASKAAEIGDEISGKAKETSKASEEKVSDISGKAKETSRASEEKISDISGKAKETSKASEEKISDTAKEAGSSG